MPRVYDPQRGFVEAPAQGPSSAPGGISLTGTTYTRGGDKNSTVRGQMEGLLADNSNYLQMNRKAGQKFAAGRGLLNSTLAAQAGEQAAIQGALPIAQADAQLSAQAAAQNMDALNAMAAIDAQRAASTAISGSGVINGNALDSRIDHERRIELMREQNRLDREAAGEDRTWRSGESAADRTWRSGESGLDRGLTRESRDLEFGDRRAERDWRSGESGLDRGLTREGWANERENAREERAWMRENMTSEQRYGFFRDMMAQVGNTLFSDPSFWRDQDGASGFMNFFMGQFGGLFDQFFGGRTAGGG